MSAERYVVTLPISAAADVAGAPAGMIERYVRAIGQPEGDEGFRLAALPQPTEAVAAEPVVWRWHWNHTAKPDVWDYKESEGAIPFAGSSHVTVEPLYPASALASLSVALERAERERDAALKALGHGDLDADAENHTLTVRAEKAERERDEARTQAAMQNFGLKIANEDCETKDAALAEALSALSEANALILAPAEDLKEGVLSRIRAVLSRHRSEAAHAPEKSE